MNDPLSTQPDSSRAAEDAFFVLRDSRLLFQRRLAEIARLAGIVSPPIVEAFTEALGEAHDELAASKQRDGFEQSHGLTASRITLMCDNDLELEIRIGDIIRRLAGIGGNALWRVHSRYMTLLRRPEMAPEDNPVGPAAIGQGLWAICRASGAGHDGNFDLLERIEEQLVPQLPELYGELNDLLAGRNVQPAQTQITSSGGTGAPSKPNPLSVLQSMINQQMGGAADGAAFTSGGDIAGGNSALNAAALVMLNQLAARLDQLESSGAGASLPGSAPNAEESVLPQAVRAKDLDLPLGKPEAIALDTLALIFEAIFATWELPDTVKTAIGRLQIPLLKLAIFDPSLFSDTEHPARRLINGMARAAVGLPRNVNRAHPVSTRLWQLAGKVGETLRGDASVLAAVQTELDALIAARDRGIRTAAQPHIPLLQEKLLRDQALLAARHWLQRVEQQGAAQEILDFLRQYWVHVIAAAHREDQEAGSLWQESEATIADLLWSVQAKQTPEERKRLAGLVPGLLKRIGAGLDRIGAPAAARGAFLDVCFNLQTAALRGNPALPVRPTEPQPASDNTPATAGIVVDLVQADGKQLKILTLAAQSPSASRGVPGGVQAGDWLQFAMNDGEQLCGQVSWLHPQSGDALLFNPDWGYAIALSAALLEKQLRDAQARVVSSQAIFDIAAERALSQLAGT